MAYSIEQYKTERAICDTARDYAESVMCEGGVLRKRNYLTKEEASAPAYAVCNNEMRGRVEQFEILRDMPERFIAYLETGKPDNAGARLAVGVWVGDSLGYAVVHTVGARRGVEGRGQRFGRAKIGGVEYSWQGPGAGMYAIFRKIKGSR